MNEQTTVLVNQGTPLNIVTTEEFLCCLRREVHAQHGCVEEPEEVLMQLLSLIRLISNATDKEEEDCVANVEDIDWALMLAIDLIKEIEKRIEQERALQKTEREELELHLNICHLIPTGPDKWVRYANDQVEP